jgi:hypothetical protein
MRYAAFCKGDLNRASYNAVPSLMAKIMELMVVLLRDTMAKACSGFTGRMRPCWRLVVIFFRRMISYPPMNIT